MDPQSMTNLFSRLFRRRVAKPIATILASFDNVITDLDDLLDAQTTRLADIRSNVAELEAEREDALGDIDRANLVRRNLEALIRG